MRFSVIVPTYNRSWLIKETVDSILNQNYKDFELIVVDDGSTDDTYKILQSYGNKIKLLKQKNSGAEIARNNGAAISNGEYLSFLDDDDLFFPNTLEVYDKVINKKNNPAFIAGQPYYFLEIFKPSGILFENKINFYTYKDYFSKDISIFTSCSMIVVRKDVFQKINGFGDGKLAKFNAHDDFRFILKVGSYGPAIIINEPKLFGYRRHNSNSVKNIGNVLNAISKLISDEKKGKFKVPGNDRKLDRYAILGSTTLFWCRRAIGNGKVFQPIFLLIKSMPIIFISILKIFNRKLSKKTIVETI